MLLQSKWVYLNPINQGVPVPCEHKILLQDQWGRNKQKEHHICHVCGDFSLRICHENPTLCSSHAFFKGKKENPS